MKLNQKFTETGNRGIVDSVFHQKESLKVMFIKFMENAGDKYNYSLLLFFNVLIKVTKMLQRC